MPNRKLAAFTIFALIMIEIATVATHWGDVKARRPDFASLYSSAELMREGRRDSSGDVARVSAENAPTSQANQPIGMRPDTLHPPFETALFVPLTLFAYPTAYVVWLGCNLAMLWAVPILLWNDLGALQREFHFIAIIYGSMYPVLVCLVQGQDAILLLLLLTLSYRALSAGRESLAGILLALCLFKFQVAVPIALLFVAARRWRVIAGFAATAVGLASASLAMIGFQNVLRYASFVIHLGLHSAAANTDDPALMPNLRGLVINTLGRIASPSVVTVTVLVISVALLMFVAKRPARSSGGDWSVRLAQFVLLACVVSYHFFPHNACVLLLPLLLLGPWFVSESVPSNQRWLFAIGVLTIYLGPNLLPLKLAMPVVGLAAIVLLLEVSITFSRRLEAE